MTEFWAAGLNRVLEAISKEDVEGFIFVGGSALSYYLNHRISEDIDLFTPKESLNTENINKILDNMRKRGYYVEDSGVVFSSTHRKALILGVKVEFVAHDRTYLNKEQNILINNLKIAKLDTLIGMKAYALPQRTIPVIRDFYDIYAITKKYGLEKIIKEADYLYGSSFNKRIFFDCLIRAKELLKENTMEGHLKPVYDTSKEEMSDFFKKEIKNYIFKKI
jgi:predicted nucleotidyltransferase component of viral defense system